MAGDVQPLDAWLIFKGTPLICSGQTRRKLTYFGGPRVFLRTRMVSNRPRWFVASFPDANYQSRQPAFRLREFPRAPVAKGSYQALRNSESLPCGNGFMLFPFKATTNRVALPCACGSTCWCSAGNEGITPINHPLWLPFRKLSGSFPHYFLKPSRRGLLPDEGRRCQPYEAGPGCARSPGCLSQLK